MKDDPIDDFGRLVASTFAKMYPGWTFERLSLNPVEAIEFCGVIHYITGNMETPHPVILEALYQAEMRLGPGFGAGVVLGNGPYGFSVN